MEELLRDLQAKLVVESKKNDVLEKRNDVLEKRTDVLEKRTDVLEKRNDVLEDRIAALEQHSGTSSTVPVTPSGASLKKSSSEKQNSSSVAQCVEKLERRLFQEADQDDTTASVLEKGANSDADLIGEKVTPEKKTNASKEMETKVATVIDSMQPILNLYHTPQKTGGRMPTSGGKNYTFIKPDIRGYAQNGTQFVVDTKLYSGNTYLSKADVEKIIRDSEAIKNSSEGQDDCIPIIVHKGIEASVKRCDFMKQNGVIYIRVPTYPDAGWEEHLKTELKKILALYKKKEDLGGEDLGGEDLGGEDLGEDLGEGLGENPVEVLGEGVDRINLGKDSEKPDDSS